MNIVLIGTGNTATVLGRKLKAAGHKIVQVFGRDNKEASALAYELNTESTNYWNVVNRQADLYLIAVSDIAVEDVFLELHLPDKTVVHTAASVPMDIFKGGAQHFGVFYPLQTLKKEAAVPIDIPLLIEASDEDTLRMLDELGHTISASVVNATDEMRMKLHLAAVLVNNFTNHLYALAQTYCQQENLDFNLLLPLIKETAARVQSTPPSSSQTGPAARGDKKTIDKHLALLANHPELKKLYQAFTESIEHTTKQS